MNSKILLLSIAVIAVGLFAMPSTLSLFSGQHTFYSGENVSCQKCHQDIYDEMDTGVSQAHITGNFTATTKCQGCHRTGIISSIPVNGTTATGTYTLNITSNPNAHSAVTLECVACHTGVPAELKGSDEAHTIYYYSSLYNPNTSLNPGVSATSNQTNVTLKGANTACVGCHTHVAVNISWKRRPGYNMTVDSSTGSWTLTFVVNTTTSSTTYTFGK